MKKYILIDGENFVHGLVHSLRLKKVITSRQQLKRLDIKTLLSNIPDHPDSMVQYYSTKIKAPDPDNSLFKAVEIMRKWNSYWTPYLANQGVIFIKAGLLKVRDSKRCSNCRHKTEVLLEKGVDVRLAVDVVSLASPKTTIYLFSSDSDLIPAIVNARKQGAKLIYIAVEGATNRAIKKSCDSTIIVSHSAITKAYRAANKEDVDG